MQLLIRALYACVLLGLSTPAIAASGDAIGSAIAVKQDVKAELTKNVRNLAQGDDVHEQELISVGKDSLGELQFVDSTKLALGPGSRMVLDEFVYDSNKSSGSIVMNMLEGTFRFVTGVAAKPTYIINMPTASISVRGTIFDLFIQQSGAAWLLLIEGAVEICNANGTCNSHDKPGELIQVSEDGNIGTPVKWTKLPGRSQHAFQDAFPFVNESPSFDPSPIFTATAIMLGELSKPEVKQPPSNDHYDRPKKKKKKAKKKVRKKKKYTKKKVRKKVAKKKRKKNNNDAAAGAAAALITGIVVYGALKGGKKHKKPRHNNHHKY